MNRTLYLLRHGETDWNALKRLQGHEDIPLNDRGRDQARLAVPVIARLDIDHCYTSDLARAFETAKLCLTHHPVLRDPIPVPDFRERHYGRMSGMTPNEVEQDRAQNPHLYRDYGDRYFPLDGEAPDAFLNRIHTAILTTINRHETPVLIVSHGGVIREIMRSLVQTKDVPQPGNCHLYRLDVQNDGWQINQIWPQ